MLKEISSEKAWNEIVEKTNGHPLQLWGWGRLKSNHGPWSAKRVAVFRENEVIGGAQILLRNLPQPFHLMAFCPR
jgi:lipid II:glycine glycyltransferase (peptidoglycan interpeptide bridge formation enzyme)